MTKLLLILIFVGALAGSLAQANSEPPLLIDPAPSPATLDAAN